MQDMPPAYRREGEWTLIELRLDDARQLFDNRDPAPFHDKDLEAAAADYIVGSAAEQPPGTALKLVVHLPVPAAEHAAGLGVERAVHTYFARRAEAARRELRALLADGRLTLAIGLGFLAVCFGLIALVRESGLRLGWPGEVAAEGLVIIGWVALWRPGEIFLYDWWPLRRRARQMERLARMPVELRAGR